MMTDRAEEPNQLSRLLVQRINAGDVDGLVDLYEDDAVLDTGDGSLATGASEIRAFWERFVAQCITVSLGRQADALVNGDLALTSTRVAEKVVTVEVARRQADGQWKWTIDQPALRIAD